MSNAVYCSVGTGVSFLGVYTARAWTWPLTSTY